MLHAHGRINEIQTYAREIGQYKDVVTHYMYALFYSKSLNKWQIEYGKALEKMEMIKDKVERN